MVQLLRKMDIAVKNHMSSIDDEAIARVAAKFESEKVAVKHAEEEKKRKLDEAKRKRRVDRTALPIVSENRAAVDVEGEAETETEDAIVTTVTTATRPPTSGRRRRRRRRRVDQKAVAENIKKTLAKMEGRTRRRRRLKKEDAPEVEENGPENLVRVTEFVSVGELADLISVPANRIIATCMELGLMVTVNQRLDFDTISLICEEFGYAAQRQDAFVLSEPEESDEGDAATTARPPVVTVMGHVDHGKTSLLDHIRKSNVIAGESGGITQHIGAYEVELSDGRRVTFIDTPGHEAFTAMRARGAQVTDLVILVVAADDGVMPQTVEAIDHARAAGVPIVVAINKIDLPDARPDRVKQALAQHRVVLEEYGGETLSEEVSAKTGSGISNLLEKVLLQAEVLDLTANPDRPARGVVIEAELDRGMGAVATVLVTSGTLKVGDTFICGLHDGRVRALLDERSNNIPAAGPATPVRILGLGGVPQAGDSLAVIADERQARDIAQKRQRLQREQGFRRSKEPTTLEELYEQVQAGRV
ncbi:MAG: translation initiation factor IF-2, partial [Gemmatimonadetes bacterium]|nr:translation initiation factor IF-2 [Gemmatimonadota bacterium]